MSENKGIAGQFMIGDGIPQGIENRTYTNTPRISLSSETNELIAGQTEAHITEALRRALDDAGKQALITSMHLPPAFRRFTLHYEMANHNLMAWQWVTTEGVQFTCGDVVIDRSALYDSENEEYSEKESYSSIAALEKMFRSRPYIQNLRVEWIDSPLISHGDDPFASVENLRVFVQAQVRLTLDEDAREIATNKAFQPRTTKQAGICWACLCSGDDLEVYERGGRTHWIHKSEECRKMAAEKPETREHRG